MARDFLAWEEKYAVGHQELDAEHRQLVDIINKICSTEYAEKSPEKLDHLFKALVLAAVEHFKHENLVMRDFSCIATQSQPMHPAFIDTLSAAAINEHCSEHARALIALELIVHSYSSKINSSQDSVGQALIRWFIDHSINHDAGLKNVFHLLKP